jgi:hypothetical protein
VDVGLRLQRDEFDAGCATRDLAVSSEKVPLMQRIAEQHKPPHSSDWGESWCEALDEACKKGPLKAFQWLAEHSTGVRLCENMRKDEDGIELPALVLEQTPANVDFLQHLYEQGLFIEDHPKTVLLNAISRAQPLEVLQWLLDHLPGSERLPEFCVMDEAAQSGRLEVLQYFQRLQLSAFSRSTFSYSEGEDADAPLWCTTKAMNKAAANGHFKVVKWLHVSRPEGCTAAAMDQAASNGHLQVVKWLHASRSEGCTTAAMDGAAANGHLKIVKRLHANSTTRWGPAIFEWLAGSMHSVPSSPQPNWTNGFVATTCSKS